MVKTEKGLLMYFHTALRNAGLFTTVSFAALGYSRYYRGKDSIFNVALILASMVFMVVTIYLTRYMILDMAVWQKEVESTKIDKYLIMPKMVLGVNMGLLALSTYTLFRQLGFGGRG